MPASNLRKSSVTMPVFGIRALMQLLSERAMPYLSRQELEWLADGGMDLAGSYARQLEQVLEGVACLVAVDSSPGRFSAGSFQSTEELPGFLNLQANGIGVVGGLIHISEVALSRLHETR